jgi:hypothetical protein
MGKTGERVTEEPLSLRESQGERLSNMEVAASREEGKKRGEAGVL